MHYFRKITRFVCSSYQHDTVNVFLKSDDIEFACRVMSSEYSLDLSVARICRFGS
ncbi:hypothetical protein TUM3792_26950 [Shewanella sp. MBTL60-007]|nr:hypothetical protein TUM3792_26950 [Shewanella sp. MBTL60-007]